MIIIINLLIFFFEDIYIYFGCFLRSFVEIYKQELLNFKEFMVLNVYFDLVKKKNKKI